MKIVFEKRAFDDFTEWAVVNKKIHRRIVNLNYSLSRKILNKTIKKIEKLKR